MKNWILVSSDNLKECFSKFVSVIMVHMLLLSKGSQPFGWECLFGMLVCSFLHGNLLPPRAQQSFAETPIPASGKPWLEKFGTGVIKATFEESV